MSGTSTRAPSSVPLRFLAPSRSAQFSPQLPGIPSEPLLGGRTGSSSTLRSDLPAGPGRRRFRRLMRSLANSLTFGQEFGQEVDCDPVGTPFVYTTAIQSSADLVTSLSGIARLARELGFQSHPETCYAPDGTSASWHADHGDLALALSVDCNPGRGTVSIAVSGLDSELTHYWFQRVEACLFGAC